MEAQLEEKNQELQRVGDQGAMRVLAVLGGVGSDNAGGSRLRSPPQACSTHVACGVSATSLLVGAPATRAVLCQHRRQGKARCLWAGPQRADGYPCPQRLPAALACQGAAPGTNRRCWPGVPPEARVRHIG